MFLDRLILVAEWTFRVLSWIKFALFFATICSAAVAIMCMVESFSKAPMDCLIIAGYLLSVAIYFLLSAEVWRCLARVISRVKSTDVTRFSRKHLSRLPALFCGVFAVSLVVFVMEIPTSEINVVLAPGIKELVQPLLDGGYLSWGFGLQNFFLPNFHGAITLLLAFLSIVLKKSLEERGLLQEEVDALRDEISLTV